MDRAGFGSEMEYPPRRRESSKLGQWHQPDFPFQAPGEGIPQDAQGFRVGVADRDGAAFLDGAADDLIERRPDRIYFPHVIEKDGPFQVGLFLCPGDFGGARSTRGSAVE